MPRCPTWDGRNGRADLRTTASWSRQTLSGHRVSLYALQMIYVTRWNTSWAPPGTGAGAAGRDPCLAGRTSLPCDSPRLFAGFERKPWHSPPCFVVCQRRPGGPFQAVRPAFPEVSVCVCVCVCVWAWGIGSYSQPGGGVFFSLLAPYDSPVSPPSTLPPLFPRPSPRFLLTVCLSLSRMVEGPAGAWAQVLGRVGTVQILSYPTPTGIRW